MYEHETKALKRKRTQTFPFDATSTPPPSYPSNPIPPNLPTLSPPFNPIQNRPLPHLHGNRSLFPRRPRNLLVRSRIHRNASPPSSSLPPRSLHRREDFDPISALTNTGWSTPTTMGVIPAPLLASTTPLTRLPATPPPTPTSPFLIKPANEERLEPPSPVSPKRIGVLQNVQSVCSGKRMGDPRVYKTEMCRFYEGTGVCRFGDGCTFAHGVDDLRSR
ncbi:hypothetical protein BC829DRAFT_247247 [Chytridium lagenaria]|nr:hypothetical protein BC829DRAFT_247247 [Chytridium lagenaria]